MAANKVLIDSGFLYALYNPEAKQYFEARGFFRRDKSIRVVPDVTLTEVAYLLKARSGREPSIHSCSA